MKLWRKMGNKTSVTLSNGDVVKITGRMYKRQQQARSGFKSTGNDLLNTLVERI